MGAHRRGIVALLVAAVLAIGGAGVAQADAEDAPTPSGPADVAIPYGDTASIEPQYPWRVASCADVRAVSDLVVSCDAESIVLSAETYDPDAGTTVIPVTLSGTGPSASGRKMTVRYRVTLEPPPAPAARPIPERAVAAGALLRVPFSEFSLACTLCGNGGGTRVLGVEPAEAGSAWTTPTHVVFRASRDYRGDAEIRVGVSDDVGSETQTGIVAFVYPARDQVWAGDVFVAVDAKGRAEIDLAALAGSAAGADVDVVGCGAAVHGTVTCADGTARYAGKTLPDQFAFRVLAGADQAWGSVTLVPEGEAVGPVPMAPSPERTTVPMRIIPPAPPTEKSGADGGLFVPFTELLDRVGAR
ncbi:hypothetical protein [Microbacterium sp. TNHR37B]|uniref:hypothetical protein n=1 Tax=Microbacterium sp. TNHR37B TaxID=1775956 RepID=UPI0007B21A74|nr:hypothetical protein [Microbacterium sp. TNHR37B]KZE91404.1 hypothetical protein AVP41_00946 [Microbacterium sp. TNHR37B]